MDVSMPRLDGIRATRAVTEKLDHTQVVVLSAIRDAETASRARSAGAAAYLFKGCPLDDLVQAIREVAASAPVRRGAPAASNRLELLERLSAAPAIAH
jgi:DNA-binding NarL/FixJ family response regulator